MTQTTPSGVRHESYKGAITLDKIATSEYQKAGTVTAQIRQEILTKSFYPSKKVASNLQANIFDAKDFGFEEQEFQSKETRMAFIPVPANSTEADVKAKLEAAHKNGACIYRVLSNQPVLDENQKYAIANAITTTNVFANSQAVRYPEGTVINGVDVSGKLTLDKAGHVQYRRTFFWLTSMEDIDVRGQEVPYLSPELASELKGASVMQGQTI